MKKIIFLLFAIVLCGLQVQAQDISNSTKESLDKSKTEKSITPDNAHVDIDFAGAFGATMALQNTNLDGENRIVLFNDNNSSFVSNAITGTNSGSFVGPNTGLIFTSVDYAFASAQTFLETARFTTDNKMGIGTTTPTEKLEVAGSSKVTDGMIMIDSTTNGIGMIIKNSRFFNESINGSQNFGTGGGYLMMASAESTSENGGFFADGDRTTIWSPGDNNLCNFVDQDGWNDGDDDPYNNDALEGFVQSDGAYMQASDRNRKENIADLIYGIKEVMQMRGVSYKFKRNATEQAKGDIASTTVGVIAQELEQIIPEAVDFQHDSYFVNYAAITPVLIEATKDQQVLIENLQTENVELKTRLAQLEAAVEALRNE